jgi:hypothetical protein
MGGKPPMFWHGDDLPNTFTFSSWAGRGGGLAATAVGSPRVSPTGWAGYGDFAGRAAHFAPSPQQYITCAAGAGAYSAGQAFTWIAAIRVFRTAAQRNIIGLGSTANNNNWRGVYLSAAHQVGLLQNRNGTTEAKTGTAPDDEQIIVGVTVDAAGNAIIKQLTASGETTLLTDTINMGGTLNVNMFSIGCLVINNAVSSYSSLFLRAFAGNTASVSSARLSQILTYFRDRMGCPLPSTEASNVLTPMPLGLQRWYNGALQTSALPTIDDLTGNNNAVGNSIAYTSHEFDYQDITTSSITGVSHIIPAGTSPFSLLFAVRRVAGRTWDTGTNLNFVSAINLMVTSLVNVGLFKYHYNGVLLSSGYDVVGTWQPGARHVGALVYDGSTLRSYIDDPYVALAAHSVGARASDAEVHLGSFSGGAGSWEHKAKDFAIYNRALSPAELDTHWRRMNVQNATLVFTGDSNIALVKQDGYAPPAACAVYTQAQRYVFPRAGFRTRFGYNDGVSGSMWETPGALAPTPIISRGAALDALQDANEYNYLVEHASTNEFHQGLYGGAVEPVVALLKSYVNTRRATGLYRAIFGFQIPPAPDSTLNGKISTYNARMLDLVGDGTLDAAIVRDARMADPLDPIYWQLQASNADARHYKSPAARIQAEALLLAMLNARYHD